MFQPPGASIFPHQCFPDTLSSSPQSGGEGGNQEFLLTIQTDSSPERLGDLLKVTQQTQHQNPAFLSLPSRACRGSFHTEQQEKEPWEKREKHLEKGSDVEGLSDILSPPPTRLTGYEGEQEKGWREDRAWV